LSRSGKLTLLQLDGSISPEDLSKVLQMGREACKEIYKVQVKALKEVNEE
jgi:ribonuclease PH